MSSIIACLLLIYLHTWIHTCWFSVVPMCMCLGWTAQDWISSGGSSLGKTKPHFLISHWLSIALLAWRRPLKSPPWGLCVVYTDSQLLQIQRVCDHGCPAPNGTTKTQPQTWDQGALGNRRQKDWKIWRSRVPTRAQKRGCWAALSAFELNILVELLTQQGHSDTFSFFEGFQLMS